MTERTLERLMKFESLQNLGVVKRGHFVYTSGLHGQHYFEKFRVFEYPDLAYNICKEIADYFMDEEIDVVVGPTTGGMLVAYNVAYELSARFAFAEKDDEGNRYFGRGFSFEKDERVLVVDDVLTTGSSINATIDAVKLAGADPVGVGVIVDRSRGIDFGLFQYSYILLSLPTYHHLDCPQCEQGIPIT